MPSDVPRVDEKVGTETLVPQVESIICTGAQFSVAVQLINSALAKGETIITLPLHKYC